MPVRIIPGATRTLSKWPAQQEATLRAALFRGGTECADPRIAVIVPVLGRPHRVHPLIESLRDTVSEDRVRLYFVAQRSDVAEVEAIQSTGQNLILVADDEQSWAKKINRGYQETAEPWLLLGADDIRFDPNWLLSIEDLLKTHPGVIGTNDLGNPGTISGTHSTHPIVRRKYADVCGTIDARRKVVHDGYRHCFPDTELVATARRRGLYVHSRDCVIEHMHPAWGKGKSDPTYELGQSTFHVDQQLFLQRQAKFGWAQ